MLEQAWPSVEFRYGSTEVADSRFPSVVKSAMDSSTPHSGREGGASLPPPPSMSVSPGSRTAHVKEQFYVVCRKLNLDEGNTARGLKVLELILGMGIHPLPDAFRGGKGPLATSGSASKQQNSIVGGRDYFCSPRDYEANMWTACALFIANTQEGHATGTAVSVAEWNGVKFSTLMIATKLRIMAFFDNMGVIQNHSKRGTLNMCRDFD